MGKIRITEETISKDEEGNARFDFRIGRKGLFSCVDYTFQAYMNRERNCYRVKMVKLTKEGKPSIRFYINLEGELRQMHFDIIDAVKTTKYNLIVHDVMYNKTVKKIQVKTLKEFDEMVWEKIKIDEDISVLVDFLTDIFDTNMRDNARVDDLVIKDFDLFKAAVEDFFMEADPNVDLVEQVNE